MVCPAQRQLGDQQQSQGGLAAAWLAGDRHRRRPVAHRREQRIEMNDGPGPAQRLADEGTDPAHVVGLPLPRAGVVVGHPARGLVTERDRGGRHPAGDRVQRLALHIRRQVHPLPRQ